MSRRSGRLSRTRAEARAAFGGAHASLTGNPTDAIRLPFHQWPDPRPAGSSPRPVSKSQTPGTARVRDADITDASSVQGFKRAWRLIVLAARLPHPGLFARRITHSSGRGEGTQRREGRVKPFMERRPRHAGRVACQGCVAPPKAAPPSAGVLDRQRDRRDNRQFNEWRSARGPESALQSAPRYRRQR